MLGHEGGQDPDHHDVGVVLGGLGLGGIEAGAYLGLQLERGLAGQRAGRDVEFDVVGAQFGLVRGVGDGGQDLLIAQRRLVIVVDQIAFDFHTGQRPVEFETRLGQHGLEHVQAQLDLASILAALSAAELRA